MNIGFFMCIENVFYILYLKIKWKVLYYNVDMYIIGEVEMDGVVLLVVDICVGGGRYDGVVVWCFDGMDDGN